MLSGVTYSELEAEGSGRPFYHPDTHLTSPLQLERVEASYEEVARRWHRSLEHLESTSKLAEFHSLFAMWCREVSRRSRSDTRRFLWDQIGQEVADACIGALSCYLGVEHMAPGLREYSVSGVLCFYLEASRWIESVVKEVGYKITERGGSLTKDTHHDLSITAIDAAVMIEFGGYYSRIDYSCLLMMSDVLQQRSITLLSADLGSRILSLSELPLLVDLLDIYEWGDKVLQCLGNQGFTAIKCLEPLTIAEVLKRNPDVEYGRPALFCQSMEKDLMESLEQGNEALGVDLLSILQRVSLTPQRLLQVFGLFRHWGHPFVDVRKSIRKNRNVAEPEKHVSSEDTVMLKSAMVRLLAESFRLSMGPSDGRLGVESCSPLVRQAIEKTGRLPVGASDEEVASVRFCKSIEWEGDMNILDIFSDKACGLSLSELTTCLARKVKGSWERRRTLVRMFSEPTLDLDAIVKDLDENGVALEDATIGVTPKERELKVNPRLFSLLSMRLKYYFGLSEMLLAKNILPRIKEITMTDDSIKLFKKQSDVTSQMKSGSSVVAIVINIDFEKWNLNMRECQTRPGFELFDQIFGFKQLFTMTHSVFKKCLFYCFDGFHYPDVVDGAVQLGDLAWRNQEGGCEGLRQKGWTLVTVSILKYVLGKYGVPFRLMGQGDNEVPVLFFPIREKDAAGRPTETEAARIRSLFSRMFDDLIETCTRVGLPIKRDETWSSSYLFTYGKFPILRGVPQSVSLKRLARCFPLANEDYPSMYVAISSISANAQSACLNSNSFLLAYIVQMICCGVTIRSFLNYHPLCGKALPRERLERILRSADVVNINLDNHDLIEKALLVGDASVGGLPVSNPLAFLCRGFPDSVALFMTWAGLFKEYGEPGLVKSILMNYAAPIFSREVSYERLLENPTSLNILSPNVKENLLKTVATRLFLETPLIKNRELKNVVQYFAEESGNYAGALCERETLAPRVLSDILAQSPIATAFGVISKLTSTKTIRHLMKGEANLRDRLIASECSCLAIPLIQAWRAEQVEVDLQLSTVGERCSWMREKGWRKKIIGVTVEHPFSFLTRVNRASVEGGCTECPSNPVFVVNKQSWDFANDATSLGPYKPYFGSAAMFSFPQLHDHVSEIPSSRRSRVKRLLALRSVFATDTTIKGTCDGILEAITGEAWGDVPTFIADLTLSSYYGLEKPGGGVLNNLYGPLTHLSSQLGNFHTKSLSSLSRSILFQTVITVTQACDVLCRLHAGRLVCGHWHYRKTSWKEDLHQSQSSSPPASFRSAEGIDLVWIGPIQSKLNLKLAGPTAAELGSQLERAEICEVVGEALAAVIRGAADIPVGSLEIKLGSEDLLDCYSYALWFLKRDALLRGTDVFRCSDMTRVSLFNSETIEGLRSAYQLAESFAYSSEDFVASLYCEENEGLGWEQPEDLLRNRLVTLSSTEPTLKYTMIKNPGSRDLPAAWILLGLTNQIVDNPPPDWPRPSLVSLDALAYLTTTPFSKQLSQGIDGLSSIRWAQCKRVAPGNQPLVLEADEVINLLIPTFLCRKRLQFYVWIDVFLQVKHGSRRVVVINDQGGDVTSALLRVGAVGGVTRAVVRDLGFFWRGQGIVPWDKHLLWSEGMHYTAKELSSEQLRHEAPRDSVVAVDLTHLTNASKVVSVLVQILQKVDSVAILLHLPRFRSRTNEFLISMVGSFYQQVDTGSSGFSGANSFVAFGSIRFLSGVFSAAGEWLPQNRLLYALRDPIERLAEDIKAKLEEPAEELVNDHRRKLAAMCPFISMIVGSVEDRILDWFACAVNAPATGVGLDEEFVESNKRALFLVLCAQLVGMVNPSKGDFIGVDVGPDGVILSLNSRESVVKLRVEESVLRSPWWRNVFLYTSSLLASNKVFAARLRGVLRRLIVVKTV